MPGAAVKLGPFSAGLNNVGEIGTIPDNSLADMVNFEIDVDGTLVSRPAIIVEDGAPPAADLTLHGYYVRSDGETFLVASGPAASYVYQLSAKVWTTIVPWTISGFVQYDNKIVMSQRGGSGGYWEAGVFTSTPLMPPLDGIVAYQDRFWGWGLSGTATQTTIYFSNLNVITPAQSIYDWVPTSNFITVGRGDGQVITNMVTDINALLIFRTSSTWQFTYPSSPGSGTLRVLSPTIGLENKFSIVAYENYYLLFCAGFLYQFINYKWYPLNTKKVNFLRSSIGATQFNVRVSLFSRRAIIWFYGTTYVYSIVTQTWTRWNSPSTYAGHFVMAPAAATSGDQRTALAVTGQSVAGMKKLWRITDGVLAGLVGESMTCFIRTKAYPINEYGKYKRLTYWSTEVRSASGVIGNACPIALSALSTTWDQMALTTWDALALGSWDNPLIVPAQYTDNTAFPTASSQDIVVKLKQGFRFIRSYYELTLSTDGTSRTAPARIYAITLQIKMHADVSQKVS